MNNEQVIKYIKENSKHKHAEIIAEWLLTGLEVEFFDNEYKRWTGSGGSPTWYDKVQYRLVKLKMKPAYRVYRYEGGKFTQTQERYTDGKESSLPNGAIIIQDWTEYNTDPTKQ